MKPTQAHHSSWLCLIFTEVAHCLTHSSLWMRQLWEWCTCMYIVHVGLADLMYLKVFNMQKSQHWQTSHFAPLHVCLSISQNRHVTCATCSLFCWSASLIGATLTYDPISIHHFETHKSCSQSVTRKWISQSGEDEISERLFNCKVCNVVQLPPCSLRCVVWFHPWTHSVSLYPVWHCANPPRLTE